MAAARNPYLSIAPRDDGLAAVIAGFILLLLAVALVWRGAPWPHMDDPTFVGAGIELARTGQLKNPFIANFLAELHLSRFYLQPPFHAYTMAGWIRVFGVGTASFRAFAWTWYILGGVGLWRLLRVFGLSLAACLLMVAFYLLVVSGTGLRPEAEAFGLLFLGLSLLDWTAHFPQKLGALCLLGLAVLTDPLTLGVILPFVVVRWELDRPAETRRGSWFATTVRVWGFAMALTVPLVAWTFVLMIRHDLDGFLAGYRASLTFRRQILAQNGGTLHSFTDHLFDGDAKLFTLPLLLLFVAAAGYIVWRRRSVPAGVRLLVLACAAAAVACLVWFVDTMMPWVSLLEFGALVALAGAPRHRWQRRLALAAVTVMGAWHHLPGLVDLSERRFPDPAVCRSAQYAADKSRKALVVDASTWRYAFDYEVPESTLDASFAAPLTALPAARTWVVAPARSGPKVRAALPGFDRTPRETFGGHTFTSQPICPDQPAVIP